MLIDVMDFDPRVISDGHGWHCNFHFGYGHDLIEDAKNEKSCAQVLQYLIAKADAEIHDLEDELAILQCQLKWAESDEQRDPYEVCCATFKQKIDLLTTSIKNLRNRNLLSEHDMDTTLTIQRPAERIYDIITDLLKQNFVACDEQMEDLFDEMDLLVISGSVGMELTQRETTSELSGDSKGMTRDFAMQFKNFKEPADTVSEESCSDSPKYTIRDVTMAGDMGKTDVEATGKTEIDSYECTPEGKNGFLTYLQHGESEECMIGSKNNGGGSSPLSAKMEVLVKVEEIKNDICVQHVVADFLCKTQDQESNDPVEGHQEVKENQVQSVDNIHITYGRKKSSASTILKPQGPKSQRKNLSGVRQSNPRMLKPLGKIRKRQFLSKTYRESTSPSSVVEDRSCSFTDTVWPMKAGDVAHGHHPHLLCGKNRELQGASITKASIDSRELGVSEEDDVPTRGTLASESQTELVMCLEAPPATGEVALPLDASSANLCNVACANSSVEKVDPKLLPAYDFQSLRLKLSQDPQFLYKLKVPEIKNILKLYKVPKHSKLKKEKMIEELIKRIGAAQNFPS